MHNPDPATPTTVPESPAHTHRQAAVLLRRPFAPGAIGFRAMTKAPHNGDPYGGARIAAFINAQSITQRLNAAVPGAWRMDFASVAPELVPAASKKLYLACRLTISLPDTEDGEPVEASYIDIGEMDAGSFAGLKALYSDARKRAAAAAGIGTYLYTALADLVLPIGPGDRQVQAVRRGAGKSDQLLLSPATEQWLRDGYRRRMETASVRRDLGAILAHGEPETGMGQGDPTDSPAIPASESSAVEVGATAQPGERGELVAVDFAQLGPNGADGPAAA